MPYLVESPPTPAPKKTLQKTSNTEYRLVLVRTEIVGVAGRKHTP